MVLIIPKKQLVTVQVIYYRPDYKHLLQDFVWQTEDEIPPLPRVKKFLRYWKDNISAVISEVYLAESCAAFRPVDLVTMLS